MLEGAGPISPETAERLSCDSRRLTIKPSGDDLVHSRVGRCASYAQLARAVPPLRATASSRAAPPATSSTRTTCIPSSAAARPCSTT